MTASYIDVDELRHVLFYFSKGKGKCLISREQLEELILEAAKVRDE